MHKTEIDKKIAQRAKNRLEKEMNRLYKAIDENDVGRLLKVRTSDDQYEDLAASHSDAMIAAYRINEEKTNISDVEARLLEKYEKEELDDLLSKLESVKYLFEQGEI
jgi:hypothetical protein